MRLSDGVTNSKILVKAMVIKLLKVLRSFCKTKPRRKNYVKQLHTTTIIVIY